jgi:hypothetical protein
MCIRHHGLERIFKRSKRRLAIMPGDRRWAANAATIVFTHRLIEDVVKDGTAVRVAEPGSAPALIVIELGGLREVALVNGPVAALAEAAAGRIAGVLGETGYVSVQRSGRIALVAEDDGGSAIDALTTALLAIFARPVVAEGVTLTPGAVLGMARWGRDGVTVEELFVAADQAICFEASARMQCVTGRGQVNCAPSPLRSRDARAA